MYGFQPSYGQPGYMPPPPAYGYGVPPQGPTIININADNDNDETPCG